MSEDQRIIFAEFDANFWQGLAKYSEHRQRAAEREAVAAKDIDALRRAQGAHEEMQKLGRLREDFERFVAARNTALKKE